MCEYILECALGLLRDNNYFLFPIVLFSWKKGKNVWLTDKLTLCVVSILKANQFVFYSLKFCSLRYNQIPAKGVFAMAGVLEKNKTLQELEWVHAACFIGLLPIDSIDSTYVPQMVLHYKSQVLNAPWQSHTQHDKYEIYPNCASSVTLNIV